MIIKKTMGPKGQILIPKEARDFLWLKPGSEVIIEVKNNEIRIRPSIQHEDFLENFCSVSKKLEKKIDIKKEFLSQYEE